MGKILVAEDDESIRNLVKMTLEMDGHTVDTVADGLQAIAAIQNGYDLLLLDIMLPGADGYEVFRQVKDTGVSVIFMTAKCAVTDRVFGLKLGADDYITKPFEPMELLARVEANLRMRSRYAQSQQISPEDTITFCGITLSPSQRTVCRNGESISLTAKEFELLLTLLRNKNQVMTRETLLDKVWGYDFYGGTRTVDMHIGQLRKKLGLHEALETVYKVGYKLKVP